MNGIKLSSKHLPYEHFAFISYSHRDMALAKWLQRHLERFKLPTEIHNDIDAKSRYLRPVFRDKSDLNTGILTDELRKNLEASKFLILICSKYSAVSQWVSDEAKAFVEMGRLDRIIPVIIPDGDTPETELFPIFLRQYFAEHPDRQLLGINVGTDGRQKTLIRIVSKMLNVSFDTLWKRHLRQRRIRIASWTASTAVATILAYLFAIPVSVNVGISLQESMLPTGDDVTLDVDGAEYSAPVSAPDFSAVTLPGYSRFSDIHLKVGSKFFCPVDTFVATGFGTSRVISIALQRDDSFAVYEGYVYDSEMNPLSEVNVEVAGVTALTNADGQFTISIPLAEQRAELPISLSKEGYSRVERPDEPPSRHLRFIMHKTSL